MRKIFTIGETVYDIIFKNNKQVSAKPGGAMLNTAISLGRLDLPVSFVSEIAKDSEGNLILDFLQENNVQINCIYQFDNGKTAIAHAVLDEQENASYTFYKKYPKERLNINFPTVTKDDIVLFGSFFAITHEVHDQLIKFVTIAKNAGAVIIYDPNFRKPHLKDLPELKKYILENISLSDIVRGSDEDFKLIFKADNPDETFRILQENGCPVLIYTASDKMVELRSLSHSISIPVSKVKTISTIGAGDTFNAGLLYKLLILGVQKKEVTSITKEVWMEIIQNAIQFGSHVCTHFDNYITKDFAKKIKNF